MTPGPVLSLRFDPVDLRSEGVRREVVADASARRALAARFGLIDLAALSADLAIAPWRKEGVRIEGHLRAMLTQPCVVTLEPVEQIIDEQFERIVVPEGSKLAEPTPPEVAIDPDMPDPPDTYQGTLDLGAIVEEQLALAIDPYPRAPGAALADEMPVAQDEPKSESPFAVLARLRGRK